MSEEDANKHVSVVFPVRESRTPVPMTSVGIAPSQDVMERARTVVPMTPVQTQTGPPPPRAAEVQPATSVQSPPKKE
jgi:hypothetical protein